MSNFQDTDVHLYRDSLSRPWGFRMQGGADFNFPLTIQRVFSGSPAEGHLLRGDVILAFDGYDVGRLTHKQAQDVVRVASSQLKIRVRRPYFGNPQQVTTSYRPKSTSPHEDPASVYFSSNEAPKATWQPARGQGMGDFGVQYGGGPKSPGGVTFVRTVSSTARNHSPSQDADLALQRMEDSLTKLTMNNNEEDAVDYSFMKKSVSERKKAFMQPSVSDSRPRAASCTPLHRSNYSNLMSSSYTEPSYSHPYQDAPMSSSYGSPHRPNFASKTSSLPRRNDFGWSPSPEKIAAARRAPHPSAVSQVQHSVFNPHDDVDGNTDADQWIGSSDFGGQPLMRSTSVSVLHEAPNRHSFGRPQDSGSHHWSRQHSQPAPTKKFSTSATIRVGGGRSGSQPSRVVRRFSASNSPFDGTMSLDRRHHPEPLQITIGSSWNPDYHPAYPANVLGPSHSVQKPVAREIHHPVQKSPGHSYNSPVQKSPGHSFNSPVQKSPGHSYNSPVQKSPGHDFNNPGQKSHGFDFNSPVQKAAAREIQHHISRAQAKNNQSPFPVRPSQVRSGGQKPKPMAGTYRPLQQSYTTPPRSEDPDYMSSDF